MSVTFSGDWEKNALRFSQLSEADANAVMLAGAEVVLEHALDLVPVDTGELKDSGAVDREEVSVGFGTDHAEAVEFGTSRSPAQPFLRPAVDEHQDEILEAMQKKLDEVHP